MLIKQVLARRRRAAGVALVCLGLGAVAAVPLASGGTGNAAAKGTLELRAELAMKATNINCPAGIAQNLYCFSSEGVGLVSGLGKVSESYLRRVEENAAGCAPDYVRVLSQTVRLTVAGKGEIDLTNPMHDQCLTNSQMNALTYPTFTITGGSGDYAGAAGSGILTQKNHETGDGRVGTDTWAGTLVVAGLDFDVTAPTLHGAVAKAVRAPKGATRVRVTYTVTASDDVAGTLSVSCLPRSGSRFRIGRTVVTCSATDTSANTGTARLKVTVKASR